MRRLTGLDRGEVSTRTIDIARYAATGAGSSTTVTAGAASEVGGSGSEESGASVQQGGSVLCRVAPVRAEAAWGACAGHWLTVLQHAIAVSAARSTASDSPDAPTAKTARATATTCRRSRPFTLPLCTSAPTGKLMRAQGGGTIPLRMVPSLYGAFFLSGCSALIFEALWFRQAGLAFGNSVWASSLVLAGFMAGMAAGNLIATRIGDRVRRPLAIYARAEAVVALSGLALVLLLPAMGAVLAPILRPLSGHLPLLNLVRLLLAFVLLLVPSTAMGLTLPLLSRVLSGQPGRFGTVLGQLYGGCRGGRSRHRVRAREVAGHPRHGHHRGAAQPRGGRPRHGARPPVDADGAGRRARRDTRPL